jgi:hypothetical protein
MIQCRATPMTIDQQRWRGGFYLGVHERDAAGGRCQKVQVLTGEFVRLLAVG